MLERFSCQKVCINSLNEIVLLFGFFNALCHVPCLNLGPPKSATFSPNFPRKEIREMPVFSTTIPVYTTSILY